MSSRKLAATQTADHRGNAGRRKKQSRRVPAVIDIGRARMTYYATRILAEPNRYAICVPYADVRPKPKNNDAVHVRRWRGDLYEDTLRVVRIIKGRVRLELKGSNNKARNSIDYPGRKGEAVELKGLVVGYSETVPF